MSRAHLFGVQNVARVVGSSTGAIVAKAAEFQVEDKGNLVVVTCSGGLSTFTTTSGANITYNIPLQRGLGTLEGGGEMVVVEDPAGTPAYFAGTVSTGSYAGGILLILHKAGGDVNFTTATGYLIEPFSVILQKA